jgi:uncharacterized protein (DUF736 family)
MAYIIKPGQASLFKNDSRTAENNQPVYKGEGVDLSGKPIRLSLWKKTSSTGKEYLSISMQPKEEKPGTPTPAAIDDDSSIPF